MDKAHARMPDWMTFNGYAGQYATHPLTADPGDLVRFWVVDADPSIDTDFHVVGIFDTVYPFGDGIPSTRFMVSRPSPSRREAAPSGF
jgi:nitrite reductase (NO-forming)